MRTERYNVVFVQYGNISCNTGNGIIADLFNYWVDVICFRAPWSIIVKLAKLKELKGHQVDSSALANALWSVGKLKVNPSR